MEVHFPKCRSCLHEKKMNMYFRAQCLTQCCFKTGLARPKNGFPLSPFNLN